MNLMEGLSGWLKQIVAVVLLASLVDLLLPNRTMQRYVRLVAGLFVLLTVATPLLKWMQSDFGGKLAAELDSASRREIHSGDQLSRIEKDGRRLRERQHEDAAGLVAARLAEAMRVDIERNEHRPVRNVEVKVETEPDGRLSVRGVIVTLETANSGDGSSSQASDTVKPMDPLAPVTVEVLPPGLADEAAIGTQVAADESDAAAPDRPTRLRISALIAARYGIPADDVVVMQSVPSRN